MDINSNIQSFINEINEIADEFEGTYALNDIVTDEFMVTNTKYGSLQEMVDSFGKLENAADINNSPEFDNFISENTEFESFQDILQSATLEMIRDRFNS
jgi:hypothetical protein